MQATYVPILVPVPPQLAIASMHTVRGLHSIAPSACGAPVMSGADRAALEHDGMMKVGVAVMPDAHSTQVLSRTFQHL
jgi:hypothetical protein